ncbi:MAG: MBL fold metallo-hydrolase [Myxococcales bacterium]
MQPSHQPRKIGYRHASCAPWLALCTSLLMACGPTASAEPHAPVANAQTSPPPGVGFAILKTARRSVREGLLFDGGDFGKQVETAFSAILVKHGEHYFLFDSGLGRDIARQYNADMPWWRRLSFTYDDPVSPARAQLDAAHVPPIDRIVLSHAHWDHASGLTDFPGVEIWASDPEMHMIHAARSGAGSAWPSQVSSDSLQFRSLRFRDVPYEGFAQSLDLFDDGSVVLVPMYGHTPGSIGMFVRVDSGKRAFFVGDVVWNAGALAEGKPKFWLARSVVDQDAERTLATIGLIRGAMQRDPDLVVLPAHDGAAQAELGFFPHWIR